MALDSQYASEVRQNLGLFPVWPPGDAISPGDIGTLHKGIFQRAGTLADLVGGVDLQLTRQLTDRPTRFQSSDCTSGELQAEGGGPVQVGVDVNAKMTVIFGSEGGVAFDAEQCEEITIDNMLRVASAITDHRQAWKEGFVLVSRVTVARNYRVIVSGGGHASVDLIGAANILRQWNIAKAGVSATGKNQGGYERSGSGPILLGLYGFDWMFKLGGGNLHPLALEGEDEATSQTFIELPPRDPTFDGA